MNFVGFHEAGKTSLAKRLLGDKFDIKEESTEGIALHYIESNFNKDTERGESWVKSELTADKIHEPVKAKIASELENSKPTPNGQDDDEQSQDDDENGDGVDDDNDDDSNGDEDDGDDDSYYDDSGDDSYYDEGDDDDNDDDSNGDENDSDDDSYYDEGGDDSYYDEGDGVDDDNDDDSNGDEDDSDDDSYYDDSGDDSYYDEDDSGDGDDNGDGDIKLLSEEAHAIRRKPANEEESVKPREKSEQIHGRGNEKGKVQEDQVKQPTQKRKMRNPYDSKQILSSSDNSSTSKENIPFTLRLWDLGGQNDFITTHHLFLDVEATTLIVMDITKDFDKTFRICMRGRNEDKDLRFKRTNPKTPAHILHYWLNSFYVEANEKKKNEHGEKKENDCELNIAIVLTHLDQIKPIERQEYIQQYKDKILESFEGKPYRGMVEKILIFEVDNKSGSNQDFRVLKDKLFQRFKKQNSWGYKMPTRWLRLQAKILEKSKKVMKFSTLKEEASKLSFRDVEVESFLNLHNSIGNLLYFNCTTKLKSSIITDPKWLVEKCKDVITHPEFIDKRKSQIEIEEEIQELLPILDDLKRGLITEKGLELLWKGDEVEFLTELMLDFDLFLPMTESGEPNQRYLIPCMLPNGETNNEAEAKDRVYLYDALQEAECGDWFKVGEFDKLLVTFAKLDGWKLSMQPHPVYGCAHFVCTLQKLYVQLSLVGRKADDGIKQDNPLFRVQMYCRKDTLKMEAKDIFNSFTQLIKELRKMKDVLHKRMGVINIKQAREFKVLCPNYDPDQDEYSTLIDAEEEDDGIIRVSEGREGCCPQHKMPLPSDQYTWLIQNVLCK